MLKNITFSAEEAAIERAREAAVSQGTTLNVMVREYIEELGRPKVNIEEMRAALDAIAISLDGKLVRKFTREEMNERR
jgi:hypothetical protein